MIVKILKSAKTFHGISYNERKNDQHKGELLCAENFSFLNADATKQDYIDYMEAVCRTNERVKNKQFHAVISCKGDEYTYEQLRNIGIEYLKQMGYGKCPYLIYAHSDTDNNHIHIVSTRVNKAGKKVNDSMERIRSQKIIDNIMNIDNDLKAKEDIKAGLLYNFSTVAQFKMVLEKRGWKLLEQEGKIKLIKGGFVRAEIERDKINNKSKEYIDKPERKKQIAAILYKYKEGRSKEELTELMKEKFGIELIFHTAKGHSVPYGYSIIDNHHKNIFKGSEVMKLNKIINANGHTNDTHSESEFKTGGEREKQDIELNNRKFEEVALDTFLDVINQDYSEGGEKDYKRRKRRKKGQSRNN